MKKSLLTLVTGFSILALSACPPPDEGTDASTPVDAGVSDAATGQDSATGNDAATQGCGSLTFQGECAGDVVRYCNNDTVVEMDCVAENGSDATCGLLDCTGADCQGYYCVAKTGTSCADLGCDVSAGEGCIGGVCATSTTCDPSSYTVTCNGNSATYCSGVVNEYDCTQGGTEDYICEPPSDSTHSACVGLVGADCGTGSTGTIFGCAAGLQCSDIANAGTCEAVTAEDGGVGDATVSEDSAVVEDAGSTSTDAGMSTGDAGSTSTDADMSTGDAGSTSTDAGMSTGDV